MRFPEFFAHASKPLISFELFPPKTEKGMGTLRAIIPEFIELNPSYMTVTYGAMGTTQSRTLEIASLIQSEFGLETASHLTCVGSSRADLDRILSKIHEAGIRNIVALRGDPPQGESDFVPPTDGLGNANELVEHIRSFEKRMGVEPFGLAVAGYPEKHIQAPDLASDLKYLKQKVEAGGEIVITQLFYDNEDYFSFVEKARAAGIEVPIVPGLMPIQSAKQIIKIASMCGSKIPGNLRKQLEEVGDDLPKAHALGVKQCIAQAKDLLARGAPGLHFYTLNKVDQMQQIIAALSI